MKIQNIIGLCSLALLILHSSLVGAVQKEKEDERWTQPKPPEYGPRWQVPENMRKGQSGQAGTGSDSQEAQFFKSGPSGSAPSMNMQTMPTTTMPTMQIAPTVGAPSLPRTQAPVVAPSRQPSVTIPGVAR